MKTGIFRGDCLTGPAYGGAELNGFLVPVVKQGFILNPRLQSNEQVAMLYAGLIDPMTVRQIGIALPPESEPCFEADVDIRFLAVPFGPASPKETLNDFRFIQ